MATKFVCDACGKSHDKEAELATDVYLCVEHRSATRRTFIPSLDLGDLCDVCHEKSQRLLQEAMQNVLETILRSK